MFGSLLLLCVLGYMVYFLISTWMLYWRNLPPGPFPLPLIGNLYLLSSDKPHLDLTRLGQAYGPVYRLNMGCYLAVVINSPSVAKEALLKRGTVFAGRPPHYVGSKFSRNGKGIGFASLSPFFRRQQKTIFRTIKDFDNRKAGCGLQGLIINEVDALCSRFCKYAKCFNPRMDLTFALGNVVGTVVFGKRYPEGDHEFWQLMDALTTFVQGLTSTSFIDAFPILKNFPFSIVNRVEEATVVRDNIMNKKYLEHKSDSDPPMKDLTHALIKEAEMSRENPASMLSEDHVIMTMNDTVLAGSETPAMILLWAILYLVKYPDEQARLHQHLDDVIGHKSFPTWEDRSKLPYLEAFIAEILRIISIMPLAIPHLATQDTTLAGHHIPKGTTVMLNLWAIHHDPQQWDAPMEFRPGRFLDNDGNFSTEGVPGYIPYGIGLRSCPGEQLARMETFLFTARLVHALEFRAAEDEPLPDLLDAEYGITLRPRPFKISVTPRH